MNIKDFFIRNRALVFNGLFFIYMFTGQIPLVNAVARIMEEGQRNLIVGFILIAVTFAEVVGIHLKLPVLNSRIGERKLKRLGWFFIIWVFHIVVNMMVTIVGLQAFGGWLGAETVTNLGVGFAFFVVIKEIYLLIYFVLRPKIKKGTDPGKHQIRELVGDVLIFTWSVIAFTTTWVYMASQGFIRPGNAGYVLIQLLGACFIFLMLFLPLRLVQFYEDWSLPRTRRQKLFSWLSFAVNVIGAMIFLYLSLPRW